MFYTLTCNPAIDMNLTSQTMKPNFVNRAFNTVYTPNGKGLNVSFVLKHFGIENKAIGFFGGFSGEYIVTETKKRGIDVLAVLVDEPTRINMFLNCGDTEYKLVGEGSNITPLKQEEMIKLITSLDDMEYLSVSGSFAKGLDPEFMIDVMKICKEKGSQVILDISHPILKELLPFNPLLIKPNDDELKDIFGLDVKTPEQVLTAMEFLKSQGAQNVLLTLGDKGAYFYNGQELYYSNSVPIKLLSSACAGDSTLAAFLSIWLKDKNQIIPALKRACAVGADVAGSNAIGDLARFKDYEQQISVEKIF